MGIRLLVCGSKDYTDYRTLDEVLDGVHRSQGVEVLIEGGALGADRFARYWAQANKIPYKTFEAAWHTEGRSAGPRRNKRMIDEGMPDLVIAFPSKPLAETKGTANMVSQARRAHVTVSIIEP